ncbi:MAG: sorbosone dehydrogenase family protein [Armatimonadota bacterium]
MKFSGAAVSGSIAVTLTLLLAAGCGGGGNGTPTPQITASASPSPTPAPTPDPSPNQSAPIPSSGLIPVTNFTPSSYRVTADNLPPPFATGSASNGPSVVPRPSAAGLTVPPGFHVYRWAENLPGVRTLATAPNGDVFAVESGAGNVIVLRDANHDGIPETRSTFASGLRQPFGIAFYPPGPSPLFVYVANTDSVVRFAYSRGAMQASGNSQVIVSGLPTGGHWTRGLAFRPDGAKMYVSVGSAGNANEGEEERRAAVLEYNADGSGYRRFAAGLRNPVSLAFHPTTGALWTTVNERDGLGDDLVPDFVTSLADGGFYGWPYFYLGANPDPRLPVRPELAGSVLVPDALFQAHSAPLGIAFYTGTTFPVSYHNNAFVAFHGSWNRGQRTGYKVVRLTESGGYEDFIWGWAATNGSVWGRPVGIAVAGDGSLLISDDGGNCIWRVTYGLTPPAAAIP